MKKIILIFVCISIAIFFLFIGCEKKKTPEPAREEVITEFPQDRRKGVRKGTGTKAGA